MKKLFLLLFVIFFKTVAFGSDNEDNKGSQSHLEQLFQETFFYQAFKEPLESLGLEEWHLPTTVVSTVVFVWVMARIR